MTILIVLTVVFAGGVFLHAVDEFAWYGFPALLAAIFGGVGLFIGLMFLPLARLDIAAQLTRVEAIRATAESARLSGDGLEGAAFRQTIAETNAWLASQQFWNGTAFDIWIPDAVMTIAPIEVGQ